MDILIIDDSAFIRAFTRIHLAEAGYEVGEMNPTSLFDVLQAIHTHRPALVITDYEMPFCNGETLIRAIREDPVIMEVPIMVLSAHRESDLVERLSQWDLAGYIVKPIKPEDLVATVRRHLLPSKP
ncbi:MAG: response regulator [Holophaga sp.]|nr:response regulator [Holophaga sp.]